MDIPGSHDSGVRVEFGGDDFLIDSHLMLMTKKDALALRKRFLKALDRVVSEQVEVVLELRRELAETSPGEHNARLARKRRKS